MFSLCVPDVCGSFSIPPPAVSSQQQWLWRWRWWWWWWWWWRRRRKCFESCGCKLGAATVPRVFSKAETGGQWQFEIWQQHSSTWISLMSACCPSLVVIMWAFLRTSSLVLPATESASEKWTFHGLGAVFLFVVLHSCRVCHGSSQAHTHSHLQGLVLPKKECPPPPKTKTK